MKEILIGLAAITMVALIEGVLHTVRFFSDKKESELHRRLKTLGGTESASLSLLRQGKLSSMPVIDGLLRGIPIAERLEALIEQAQLEITVARLISYSLLAALFGTTVGVLLGGIAPAVVLGGAALMAPLGIIYLIREERSRKLTEQLPDALDMMARSLRAGHALSSAFKLVATEMPSPVNVEFGRAFEEQNLGISFEQAVVHMTQRAPSNRDLKIFAVSVIVQKETGGNLVEIIENISETIRGRYRFFGKLRALTAEGRLSGLVIGMLPIITSLALAFMNPSYMSLLVTTKVGQSFLIYAVISWFLGFMWLRKMARVDY